MHPEWNQANPLKPVPDMKYVRYFVLPNSCFLQGNGSEMTSSQCINSYVNGWTFSSNRPRRLTLSLDIGNLAGNCIKFDWPGQEKVYPIDVFRPFQVYAVASLCLLTEILGIARDYG